MGLQGNLGWPGWGYRVTSRVARLGAIDDALYPQGLQGGGATLKLRPEDVDFTGYPTAKTFVGKRGGGWCRVGLPSWG